MSTYKLDQPIQYFCKGCGENFATLTHYSEYTKAFKGVHHDCQCAVDKNRKGIEFARIVGAEAGRRSDLRLLELFLNL